MKSCPYCHVLFGPCVAPPEEHIRGHLEDRLKHHLRNVPREHVRDIVREARARAIPELNASITWRE